MNYSIMPMVQHHVSSLQGNVRVQTHVMGRHVQKNLVRTLVIVLNTSLAKSHFYICAEQVAFMPIF